MLETIYESIFQFTPPPDAYQTYAESGYFSGWIILWVFTFTTLFAF